MEDWKQKLVKSVRQYINREDLVGNARYMEMGKWLTKHNLKNLGYIETAQHVVELMEMIDRWHDEDVAKQPCAAPAPPTNPFIFERTERELLCGTQGALTVKACNHEFVNIAVADGRLGPSELRALARQLNDLAAAHETIYPPTDACAKAC